MRILLIMVYSYLIVACTAFQQGENAPFASYSAIQTIDTIPGPFVSTIYVAADRERQDAFLGGKVVTTIIRRDKGIAWLLIPSKKQYQEVELNAAEFPSIQARFPDLERRVVGQERVSGKRATKYAYLDASGRQIACAWVSDEGIALKTEVLEDPVNGKPKAIINLKNLRFARQDKSLFEVPLGYSKQVVE